MISKIMEYCANIGRDPLLVQGAGGNVSWKENDILWIKASGTWLAEAKEKNIFVPVNLLQLQESIKKNDFSVIPKVNGASSLKPSIETLLHALMPQRIVVHLHAIEVLARLVRGNCQSDFQHLLGDAPPWILVDYHQPGEALAKSVHHALKKNPLAKIIFLKNHGVVIGGENIEEINNITLTIIEKLKNQFAPHPYIPTQDHEIHQLALNPILFDRLKSHWALYPDHVVFLGQKAFTYLTWEDLRKAHELPELVFIKNEGVYIKPSFNKAKQLQLRCYYDVISRQKSDALLTTLTQSQITELLNWDAEIYRMNIFKNT